MIQRIVRAVQTTPWAIEEEKLEAILEFLELRAERHLTAEEIQARIGPPQNRKRDSFAAGGVAVLPLFGVMSHRMGSLSAISGGTSTEAFAKAFGAALDNPDVGTIVLDVDSPGGSVFGVEELARTIFEARGRKRIIAVSNALMASAAYWVGSAAEELVVIPSGKVGNIGVFQVHRDTSAADEKAGIRTTIIRAGRMKASGSPYEPLSEEARAALQQEVDDYYRLFTEAVARHRGVGAAAVRSGFGEGLAVTAQRALSLGMVDRIATLDEVLEELGVSSMYRLTTPAAELTGAAAASLTLAPAPASEAKETSVETTAAAQNGAGTTTPAPLAIVDATAEERRRATEILAMCRAHGVAQEKAESYVASNLSRDQVASAILADRRAEPVVTPKAPEISTRERRRYSVARALLAMDPESRVDAGYEREVSQELARTLGRKPKGLLIATGLGVGEPQAAGLDSGTATKGAEVVFTEPGSFIELLRKRAMVARLGATMYPGLQGDVSFPKQNGAGTAVWTTENPGSDISESNLLLTTVTLSPKTLMSTTSFSRQLLAQANLDIEALVRADLATIHALAIDAAAISGDSDNDEPDGVLNVSGIGDVALGTNGGVPDFADIVDLETQITQDDADLGSMAYLTTPAMRGLLKKTEMFDGTNGMPIWTGGVDTGEMNGYRAAASNQVPSTLVKASSSDCHGILFGVWSQLLIGEWGAFDIIVDPYRLKKQNMIEVTSFQLVDIAVRYAQAFAAIQDARLSA